MSQLMGTSHCILTRMHIKMVQDIGNVSIDRAAADEEDLPNHAVCLPISDQSEHLVLTIGQSG